MTSVKPKQESVQTHTYDRESLTVGVNGIAPGPVSAIDEHESSRA